MILADGDVVQYQQLKVATIADYLTKLDNFVSKIESVDKHQIKMPTNRKK